MAAVGVVLWFLLALWSIAAFWQHIDELKPTYPNITKLGAIAGEVALLALVLWHCFSKHIGVRFWALILSFVLSAAILVHAGALRGMAEVQTTQENTEKRLKELLDDTSKKQMQAATGKWKSKTQQEIAKKTQEEIAATVKGSADKVKDSSVLPRWYLDGWMYSALFLLSLACVGIIFALMMRNDIDADFDGVVDRLQEPIGRTGELEELEALYVRPTGRLEGKEPRR